MVESLPIVRVEVNGRRQILHSGRPLTHTGVGPTPQHSGCSIQGINSEKISEVIDGMQPISAKVQEKVALIYQSIIKKIVSQ